MPRPAGAEGERNAKLDTETDVEAILRQLHAGVTQRALAAEFGVSSGNLNSIAKGKTWPAVYERVSRELAAAPPDGWRLDDVPMWGTQVPLIPDPSRSKNAPERPVPMWTRCGNGMTGGLEDSREAAVSRTFVMPEEGLEPPTRGL